MSPTAKIDAPKAQSKLCPVCETKNPRNASECSHCEHGFSNKTPPQKTCGSCDGLNPVNAKECLHCGDSFETAFSVSLREALRVGVISRGINISEEEAKFGEQNAANLRSQILASGDEKLINILRVLPEEAYGRLASIFKETA